ncbi:MAG: hypothetical protein ACFFD2_11620 [Promethearchaeota archaeon]
MSWKEILSRIKKEIRVKTKIPHTRGGFRPVTKIEGSLIYMRTGVNSIKYTTIEMVRFAFEKIQLKQYFKSSDLKSNFPQKYSQGDCVFSMTGGILQILGLAKYIQRRGYVALDKK